MKKKRNKTKTLDRVLIFLAVFFVLFAAAVLWVFVKTGGQEPSVLVAGVTGAVVAEILACLRIKIGKQRLEYKDTDDNISMP